MLCYEFRFTFLVQKSATFEKQNEAIEAFYLIFQRINGKAFDDENQRFSFGPLESGYFEFYYYKALNKNGSEKC